MCWKALEFIIEDDLSEVSNPGEGKGQGPQGFICVMKKTPALVPVGVGKEHRK